MIATGNVQAAMGSSGMAGAEARVAAIRARIDGLVGSAGSSVPAFRPDPPAAGTVTPLVSPAASAVFPAPAASGTPTTALAARLPEQGRPWAAAIEQAARTAGVDPSLFAALVRHESNFDPDVVSTAGAIGLAQLMPGTAAGLGVDPHDPQQNLAGGASYLRQQLDRFGSADLALAAYNAGPSRVAQAGGVPRIAETQAYVPRVLATWEQYR